MNSLAIMLPACNKSTLLAKIGRLQLINTKTKKHASKQSLNDVKSLNYNTTFKIKNANRNKSII